MASVTDGVEVRAVGRQEDQMRTRLADRGAHGPALVAAEVVDNEDISRRERRGQDLLDIGGECLAVDRTVEDAWRVDPVGAQGGDEGECPPMPMRGAAGQTLTTRPPAPERGHVGLHPGLIDEDEPPGIDPPLMPPPTRPACRDLRALCLAGQQGFF